MSNNVLADEVERHRCRNTRDGLRCHLMTSHRPAHAAMTEKGTRTRWDETRSWVEVEDYRFRVELEQLPWAPSYPRIDCGQ